MPPSFPQQTPAGPPEKIANDHAPVTRHCYCCLALVRHHYMIHLMQNDVDPVIVATSDGVN